jgi:hypothetical protein
MTALSDLVFLPSWGRFNDEHSRRSVSSNPAKLVALFLKLNDSPVMVARAKEAAKLLHL